ncbi:pilus assembly FimT family protein [Photobacterium atrarenae]|uniref:Prepilin-type N-terminal cleavage/methylation domain-containing protein n=1 Tax=Photobacterium atrarenae TaxID=865757 RepID=A0ABY5GD90_9GAMM|nr:prepilin-type N-terminal cleavage/methylation domain-containing protein [Photobacterium atrarenae]UTV27199.1 prepilin-type N-terminal cleavage/methylation domain-containing protein [Photobacterium atrarenae]
MTQGITLIELIISISVMSVISTFAVPSFKTIINHGEINYQSEQIFEFVRLAKLEAVKRNTRIEVFYEIDSNNNHCLGMRKLGDNDTCELASTSFPRFVINSSHHYSMKTVSGKNNIIKLQEGNLFSFDPITGKSSNSKRILLESKIDNNFVSGVRVTDIGFTYPCSSTQNGGKSQCV